MKILQKESKKLELSSFELKRRRYNWKHVTQKKISGKFKKLADDATEIKYPFNLFCQINNETINEGTVQLSSGPNKTGVAEKTNTANFNGITCESEKGSALVASFNSSGSVIFIIYPYKSERYSRAEDNIILYDFLNPDDVNDKLIDKAICKYLLYIRNSSVYGAHSVSLIDRLRINWMTYLDVRNRRKMYQGFWLLFVEWSKVLGAGIAGYIVAVLTQTP